MVVFHTTGLRLSVIVIQLVAVTHPRIITPGTVLHREFVAVAFTAVAVFCVYLLDTLENRWQMATQPADALASGVRLRWGVKALISVGERVLLVQERHSHGGRYWTLPGGGVEHGEEKPRALERELAEELRCDATVREPLSSLFYAHTSRDRTVSMYTVFDCRLRSVPSPNPTEGVLSHCWVDPDTPPPRTLLPVQAFLTETSRFETDGDGTRRRVSPIPAAVGQSRVPSSGGIDRFRRR